MISLYTHTNNFDSNTWRCSHTCTHSHVSPHINFGCRYLEGTTQFNCGHIRYYCHSEVRSVEQLLQNLTFLCILATCVYIHIQWEWQSLSLSLSLSLTHSLPPLPFLPLPSPPPVPSLSLFSSQSLSPSPTNSALAEIFMSNIFGNVGSHQHRHLNVEWGVDDIRYESYGSFLCVHPLQGYETNFPLQQN